MDLDELRAATQQAWEEAGETDADLSYIDDEALRFVESAGNEAVEAPENTIHLWNAVFYGGVGSQVVGKGIDQTSPGHFHCKASWYGPYRWYTRRLIAVCDSGKQVWRITNTPPQP